MCFSDVDSDTSSVSSQPLDFSIPKHLSVETQENWDTGYGEFNFEIHLRPIYVGIFFYTKIIPRLYQDLFSAILFFI